MGGEKGREELQSLQGTVPPTSPQRVSPQGISFSASPSLQGEPLTDWDSALFTQSTYSKPEKHKGSQINGLPLDGSHS